MTDITCLHNIICPTKTTDLKSHFYNHKLCDGNNKRNRNYKNVGDFWYRVDYGDIDISKELKIMADGIINDINNNKSPDTSFTSNKLSNLCDKTTTCNNLNIENKDLTQHIIPNDNLHENINNSTQLQQDLNNNHQNSSSLINNNTINPSDYFNFNIITTSVADYSYKSTPFGDVYYSPRFQDNKYIYRFVILTKGVRNEAYRILKASGTCLLTEYQIIRELSIDLSPGWEHFMLFRNRLDELILRRKINT